MHFRRLLWGFFGVGVLAVSSILVLFGIQWMHNKQVEDEGLAAVRNPDRMALKKA